MASQLTRAEVFDKLCNHPQFSEHFARLADPEAKQYYCNAAKGLAHPNSGVCSNNELNTWLDAVTNFYVTEQLLNNKPMTSLDRYHTSNDDLSAAPPLWWLNKCNEYKHSVTGSHCPCNPQEVEAIKAFARARKMDFNFDKSAGSDTTSGSGFQGDWPFIPDDGDSGGDEGGGRRRKRRRPRTRKLRKKKKLTKRGRTKRK